MGVRVGSPQAVKCRYAGVTFKSLTEAHWACLFDVVGVQWSYEKRFYEDYLPDFYLPRVGVIEVKYRGWDRDNLFNPAVESWRKIQNALGSSLKEKTYRIVMGTPIFHPTGGQWAFDMWIPSEKSVRGPAGFMRGLLALSKKIRKVRPDVCERISNEAKELFQKDVHKQFY